MTHYGLCVFSNCVPCLLTGWAVSLEGSAGNRTDLKQAVQPFFLKVSVCFLILFPFYFVLAKFPLLKLQAAR